ncbi:nucleotidyltransferase substrate binding protein [Desulfonatronum thioautotrophicum]|uniref:nucleotidyltransferase substrate binding protein n=1 Tax=Desulfonatronum thioautotrophicum TaxID=617001 RepID=UPI0005EB21F1|nr:nucleotidyltransferase substrate binding protein [Desulfonatronum thioautotrophicum]
MSTQDIRWLQRLGNYAKALGQLGRFIAKGRLNELEEQGLIQSFEYTYELAWNTLKDYLEMQGETGIHGSRDALRLAFRRGLIEDGETWMEMIKSRTLTSHTYSEELCREIVARITGRYYAEFVRLHEKLDELKRERT